MNEWKAAAGRNEVFVLEREYSGIIRSCNRLVEPFGELAFEDAVDGFKEQARQFLRQGVKFFHIGPMTHIQEARAALLAVKEVSDLFVLVTMAIDSEQKILYKTEPGAAVVTLQSLGADSVGIEGDPNSHELIPIIQEMKKYARVPLAFCLSDRGYKAQDSSLEMILRQAYEAGIAIFWGGISPDFERWLQENFAGKPVCGASCAYVSAVSSAERAFPLEEGSGFYVIGERINPSGKKVLQQGLKEKNYSLFLEIAQQQVASGAGFLDVNTGLKGDEGREALVELIKLLSREVSVPLVPDSPYPEQLEAALRIYPGRGILNSISGVAEKFQQLFPVAAKYGAMVICQPFTEEGIPPSAEERIEIARAMVNYGKEFGLSEEDFIIDALVQPLSKGSWMIREILKTLRLCSMVLGLKSVIGLSNLSFGQKERRWINASFLSMAMANGLSFVIADPLSREVMESKRASELLLGKVQVH